VERVRHQFKACRKALELDMIPNAFKDIDTVIFVLRIRYVGLLDSFIYRGYYSLIYSLPKLLEHSAVVMFQSDF